MATHPFPGATITTRYGAPAALGGGAHTGTDYAYGGGSCGRPVYAAQAGVARRAENTGGGHGVLVDAGGGVEWGYWHLSRQVAATGQRVREGQLIGYSGASGTLVTGCHLHLELKVNGQLTDPAPIVAGGKLHTVPEGSPDSFPRDPGYACPPGYVPGTVNPRVHGAIPGTPWWNRPTNPDGTVNACIRQGLAPGDNTALTDVGESIGVALAAGLPILANGAIIIIALILGWTGVKEALGIRGGPSVLLLPGRKS